MAVRFEIPDWLLRESSSSPPPPSPPIDDHRVEGLVNDFIAGKHALFTAPPGTFPSFSGRTVASAYRETSRDSLGLRLPFSDASRQHPSNSLRLTNEKEVRIQVFFLRSRQAQKTVHGHARTTAGTR